MATVRNPSGFTLNCRPLDRELKSGEVVEVDEETAKQISTVVFEVKAGAKAPRPVPEAKATRRTVRRGGKEAEVSGPPTRETR